MQRLPDHFGPGPVNGVLQQVVQSCIDCAYQPKILLSALQTHSGGGEVVRGKTTESRKQKVLKAEKSLDNSNRVCVAAVRTDGGVCVVKLPTASSASFVLRFLETMCRHLQCDNLFSSQPFSHYAVYDRTKSGKTCLHPQEGSCWSRFNSRPISAVWVGQFRTR